MHRAAGEYLPGRLLPAEPKVVEYLQCERELYSAGLRDSNRGQGLVLFSNMECAPELDSAERPAHLDPGRGSAGAALTQMRQDHDGEPGMMQLGQELAGRTVGEVAG